MKGNKKLESVKNSMFEVKFEQAVVGGWILASTSKPIYTGFPAFGCDGCQGDIKSGD